MNIILFEDKFFRGADRDGHSGRSGALRASGGTVYLPPSDERADHIRRILKLEPGDTFKAGIVNGPAGEMRLEEYERRDGEGRPGLRLSWTETGPPVGLYPLILLVGYTRPISAKRILREAASLGVEHIVFTGTESGEKSYREAKLWKGEGVRRFLIDGLQQAGGTMLPEVHHTLDLCEALSAAESVVGSGESVVGGGETEENLHYSGGSGRGGLIGGRPGKGEDKIGRGEGKVEKSGIFRVLLDNEIGESSLSSLDLRAPSRKTDRSTPDGEAGRLTSSGRPWGYVILAVGSERGWTGRERDKFLDAGYLPATLGSRVLRTETACAAGVALSLSRMGFV